MLSTEVSAAALSAMLSTVLSVLAAGFSGYWYTGEGIPVKTRFWDLESALRRLEEILSYRMSNIYYSSDDRGAILTRWKLIAPKSAEGYFDMGWVRIFYWYGIIPGLVIVAMLLVVLYMSWKKKDIWTVVIVLSVSIYTVVEATFVTRYIGRDFFLLIAGVYIGEFFRSRLSNKKEGVFNA